MSTKDKDKKKSKKSGKDGKDGKAATAAAVAEAELSAKEREAMAAMQQKIAAATQQHEVAKEEAAKGTLLEQLFAAIKENSVDEARAILAERNVANERATAFPNQAPLHLAAAECQSDFIKLLVHEYAADVNAQDSDGWTPLHYVAACTSVSLASVLRTCDILLSRREIDVCKCNSEETSVLHYIVRYLFPKEAYDVGLYLHILGLLVQRGADLSVQNQYGETPLHYAALRGNKEAAVFLLKNKVAINCLNCAEETPLHYAARNGRKEMTALLINLGADPTMRAVDGTPRDLAREHPDVDAVLRVEMECWQQFQRFYRERLTHGYARSARTAHTLYMRPLEDEQSQLIGLEERLDLFSNVPALLADFDEMCAEFDAAFAVTDAVFTRLAKHLELAKVYIQQLCKVCMVLCRGRRILALEKFLETQAERDTDYADADKFAALESTTLAAVGDEKKKEPSSSSSSSIFGKYEQRAKRPLRQLFDETKDFIASLPDTLEELFRIYDKLGGKFELAEKQTQQIRLAIIHFQKEYDEEYAPLEKEVEETLREEQERIERERLDELANVVIKMDLPQLSFLSENAWDTWQW